MTITDLMKLADSYMKEGRLDMAMELWNKCIQTNSEYGPAFWNIYSALKSKGNIGQAKDALMKWMNCPLTPNTLDFVARARQDLDLFNKQMNPPEAK